MEDINIALLIDADNISAKYVPLILSELSKYGRVTIRHMYGDWTQSRLSSWMKCSAGFSLTPVMQPNNTPGKNASDIGLIIDAMDILYTGEVQGFCIVSSDGDFNKLASRLREAGKVVIGMGEKKTPESFRASCERFIFLDIIANDEAEEEESTKAKSAKAKKKQPAQTKKKKAAPAGQVADAAGSYADSSQMDTDSFLGYVAEGMDEDDSDDAPSFTDKATIEDAIVKMIMDNAAEGRETGLGEIGSRLVKIFPDFDIRNYHYSKLSEYLQDFPSLEVVNRDSAVWVSLAITPDSEVEKQIHKIFDRHHTDDMNISSLKTELMDMNPNLDATIKRSGVTRFSVYLNRRIHSVEVNGSHVMLKG